MFLFLLCAGSLFGQETVKYDSSYKKPNFVRKMEFFQNLPVKKDAIVFLGNSITEAGRWQEMDPDRIILNRGIGGDNTFGLLARAKTIIDLRPRKLFIMIGINDMARRIPIDIVMRNYRKLITAFKSAIPQTQVYVQSVLPVDTKLSKGNYQTANPLVIELNKELQKMAKELQVTYVDLHPVFADANGELKTEFSKDGVHLYDRAYMAWFRYLKEKKYL